MSLKQKDNLGNLLRWLPFPAVHGLDGSCAASAGDSRAPPPLPSRAARPPEALPRPWPLCLLQSAPCPHCLRCSSLHRSERSPLTHESRAAPQTLHQQRFPGSRPRSPPHSPRSAFLPRPSFPLSCCWSKTASAVISSQESPLLLPVTPRILRNCSSVGSHACMLALALSRSLSLSSQTVHFRG